MKKIKLIQVEKSMDEARNYEEWKELAIEHDELSGMQEWKEKDKSHLYDFEEIKYRLDTLRKLRKKKDDEGLLFILKEGIHGNMGGMGKSTLYSRAKFGTKDLINEYIDEISAALNQISKTRKISKADKVEFFQIASQCFGRSALILSGGGQLGNFHIGVLKALCEADLIPNVIAGASAGSMFAALVGTKTNRELTNFFANKEYHSDLKKEAILYHNLLGTETKISAKDRIEIIEQQIPNLTFQEAFERTGRKINISIAPYESHQKSRLLNAISSPNVLIRSAVFASTAIPGIYPPVTLQAKNRAGKIQPYLPTRKWIDGSMSNDVPTKRLARLYGVNHFIVSLTNPLVLPFVSDPGDGGLLQPVKKFGTVLIKEVTQFNYSIAKKFFRFMPSSFNFTANTINTIIQQNYTGDINIIADLSLIRPDKILGTLSKEELLELVRKGERKTWRKLEAIRLTTQIGRTLDEILKKHKVELVT